jgi:aryl-alcohol dehydrogenase-like predicted oxidoreductase
MSIRCSLSLIRRHAAAREIPWYARHNTGVICYSPMQSGLLTDTFRREQVARFAEDDWRRRSPDFTEPNLSRNLALRDALRPIAQRHRATVSAVAVAWTLAWPGVTGAIVGGRSPQQVDGWIGAASPSVVRGRPAGDFRRHRSFRCRRRPNDAATGARRGCALA